MDFSKNKRFHILSPNQVGIIDLFQLLCNNRNAGVAHMVSDWNGNIMTDNFKRIHARTISLAWHGRVLTDYPDKL